MSTATDRAAIDVGCVEAVFTTPAEGQPMQQRDRVEALAGQGLDGDRYAVGSGKYSDGSQSSQITLIEAEAVEALRQEEQISLEPSQTRRNLITRGVPLNHLVGVEFTVGEVKLRGERLCEPCGYLERLTQSGVKAGLHHRGGLRATILAGGTIRPGDRVRRPHREHDATGKDLN